MLLLLLFLYSGNFETIDNEEDTEEDKNMLNFVERELRRRTGKVVEDDAQTNMNDARPDDHIYSIPQSLQVGRSWLNWSTW